MVLRGFYSDFLYYPFYLGKPSRIEGFHRQLQLLYFIHLDYMLNKEHDMYDLLDMKFTPSMEVSKSIFNLKNNHEY